MFRHLIALLAAFISLATPAAARLPDFAYVVFNGSGTTMRGNMDDLRRARAARATGGEMMFLRRGERAYAVRDAGLIAEARAIIRPQSALAERQAALGREQAALGRRQAAIGRRQVAARGGDQATLARQQAALADEQRPLATRQSALAVDQKRLIETSELALSRLLDKAVARGLAVPLPH